MGVVDVDYLERIPLKDLKELYASMQLHYRYCHDPALRDDLKLQCLKVKPIVARRDNQDVMSRSAGFSVDLVQNRGIGEATNATPKFGRAGLPNPLMKALSKLVLIGR